MNKGLKTYTKQLTQAVGNVANVSVNLNEEDANLLVTLPLLKTISLSPIELSLIYNNQNKNISGIFGKGVRLNIYSKLIIEENKITVDNADGSRDEYLASENYENKETQTMIEKVYDDDYEISYHYKVIDKYGNYKLYSPYNLEYPYFIRTKSNNTFNIDFVSSTKTISNNKGDVIEFVCSNGLVEGILYKKNEIELYSVRTRFTDDNQLMILDHYKENTVVASGKIEYNTNEIIVSVSMLNYSVKYTLNGEKVISLVDAHGCSFDESRSSSISYGGHKTTVTDYIGNKNYIFFDNNNFPLFEMDDDGNVVETEYDTQTKNITAKSSVIRTKIKPTNLFPSNSLIGFTRDSGVTINGPYSVNSSFFGSILNDTVCKVSGTGKLSFSVNCDGLATDNIQAIIWGRQLSNYSENSCVKVTLTADKSDNDLFKKTLIDDNFDLMTLGISTEKSYSNITLTIELIGNAVIEIGGIQVLKKDFGNFYMYDDEGNSTGQVSGFGSSSIGFNDQNLPSSSQGSDSTMYDFSYDDNGNLIHARTAYGVTIENEYDTNNNLTKNRVGNSLSILEIEKTYDSNGYLTSEIDELGNQTTYKYDSFGKVIEVTDALNTLTKYNYDEYENLKQIILKNGSNITAANYYYDDKQRLESITLRNGLVYDFEYDEKDNLTKVLLNNITMFKYGYDETNSLTLQQYGENGDAFKFEYNSKKELQKIYYVLPNNVASLRYTYEYNDLHQLKTIKDSSGRILYDYTYDIDGRLINVSSPNEAIDYQYDNLGNVNEKTSQINGKKIYQSFDNIARSKGSSPEAIVDTLGNMTQSRVATFVSDLYARGKENSIKCFADDYTESSANITIDGVIPCVDLSSSSTKRLTYVLPDLPMPMTSGMSAFWFKPTDVSSKQYLFCQKRRSGVGFIAVYMKNSKLYVEIESFEGNKYTVLISSGQVKVNRWNFFSINYMYRNDTGYSEDYVSKFELVLNGCVQSVSELTGKYLFDQGVNTTYHIGHYYDDSNYSYFLKGKLALLMIGNNRYIDTDQVRYYYRITKDYIVDNQMVDDSVSSVDFSQTNLHTINNNIQENYEIYPLQTSVKSLNGKTPIKFDIRNVTSNDKDRTFNFNNQNKHYAYVADGSVLEYDFDLSETGTIMMRAYTDVANCKQYFFEGKDTNGNKLALFKNEDNLLCIDLKGKILTSTLEFKTDLWQTVGLSFTIDIQSDSEGEITYMNLRIYLDGIAYEFKELIFFKYTKMTFMIGRTFEKERIISDLGLYYSAYPLYGQIEMLATRNCYLNMLALNELMEELKDYSKVLEFNELGLLQKVDVHKVGQTILSNTYSYKHRANSAIYSSKQIEKEIIKYGDNSTDRLYETDTLGNVTEVTDSTFGNHSYGYDYRGFLVNEDGKEYSYDNNGNITKAGTTTFGYDSEIKDRLKYVNANQIFYSSSNPGNPWKYKDIEYKFEGRRLMSLIEDMSSDEQKSVDYTYDSNGLIIKKVVGYWYSDDRDSEEYTTNYYYDGDKLITEINPQCRFDYLYDENGSLYGFIKDNNNKYFYVRDYLKNILGIVDIDGELVVKYNCDAYGNRISIDDYSGCSLGYLNPFRYKGYYYDDDVEMYYCKSRFYVPEWRRWLNNDNFSNMEIDEIGYMNLWVYAYNNPVSNVDESGQIPKWLKCALCVGACVAAVALIALTAPVASPVLVGAASGAAINCSMSIVNQLSSGDFDICQIVYDAALGAVTGAIGGSAFGKVAYCVSNTVVGGLSNVGSDWINDSLGVDTVKNSIRGASIALIFSLNRAGAQQKGKETLQKIKNKQSKIKYNKEKGAVKYADKISLSLKKVKTKFAADCSSDIINNFGKDAFDSCIQNMFEKLFSIF